MADNASDKFGEIPAVERLVESAIFYWGSVLKRRKWKSQVRVPIVGIFVLRLVFVHCLLD